MIKRINYIRDFGIFRNLRWDDSLPEFSKVNLLYGWNYSGKTTLSRIFQVVERQKLPEEYDLGSFELVLDDGAKINSHNILSSPRIRVFNRDYVRRNFEEEHTAPAVFILGEENKALRDRLRVLKNRRERVASLLKEFKVNHKSVKEQLDKAGTDKARDIGNLLGVRNFRRPNLEQRITEIRNNPDGYIFTDEQVSTHLQTLRSVEDYNYLAPVQIDLPDVAQIGREVNELLGQTASSKAIARLKENSELESWVRQGLVLHRGKTVCEFCGNKLTEERLSVLKGHFSEEYEKLVRQVKAKIKVLESVIPSPKIPDESRIIAKERATFTHAKNRLNEWLEWAREARDNFITALNGKLTAIETPLNWSGNLDRADQGTKALTDLNESIKRHSAAIKDMEATKAEIREALEKHYAANYLMEGNLVQRENNLTRQAENIKRADTLLQRIDEKIRSVEARIHQPSIGAEKLNELTRYLLAGSNIHVEAIDDTRFQFKRDGQLATHLSEGEKTAITFAYFVTSLEAGDASIEETIIFVDDPVSSLDSNHTYAVFALIVERLANAHQLFVCTHNMELFNLLKSKWLNRQGKNTKNTRAYHVWRTVDSSGKAISELRDLPRLLRAYKSEYEFIFSQLYLFSRSSSPTLHEAYTAPNLLRKFLEAYLGFRKAVPRSWSDKLDLLLDNPEHRREVQKFADEESHLQALGRSLMHSNLISNSRHCVRMVLDALQEKDPNHYDSLVEIIEGNND